MSGAEENPKNLVQSVAKAFAVLKAFDASLPELTVSEAAARAGLDRGTAFRLIHTLAQLGYLAPVPRGRRYRLTLKCLELGYTPLARADLKLLARPLLRSSCRTSRMQPRSACLTARTSFMSSGRRATCRRSISTGASAAALAPTPRLSAMRSWRNCQSRSSARSSWRRNRVRLSEQTLVEPDAILRRLAAVRAQGYAISDGENAYGLRTVAAAILDTDGAPAAASA